MISGAVIVVFFFFVGEVWQFFSRESAVREGDRGSGARYMVFLFAEEGLSW